LKCSVRQNSRSKTGVKWGQTLWFHQFESFVHILFFHDPVSVDTDLRSQHPRCGSVRHVGVSH
jgi:hypothetical protein